MAKLGILAKEKLVKLYVEEGKSLEDIGKLYGASRTAIYKKFKKFNIKRRYMSHARLKAQKQGKLPQQYIYINENFFSKWSAKMAYISGLLITDGCISDTGVISFSMNEKHLLEKVKQAMDSQHRVVPSKYQKNLYCLSFARERMVKDLYKIGIGPRKSLTVKFPKIPHVFLADFIRGVFDGDGSVFFDMRSKNFPLRTKFGGGSKDFVEKLEIELQELGLPKRNIYKQKTKNGFYYYFNYGHKDSERLFNILYKNGKNTLFLERKCRKFIKSWQRS